MPFRANCPHCGRKQTVPDAEAEHSVWCNACGGRFDAIPYVENPAQNPSDGSQIPDIDFPILPPVDSPSASSIPPPLMIAAPSMQNPAQNIPPPVLMNPQGPRSFVNPPPIVPATLPPSTVPIVVAVVFGVGLVLAIGLFLLGTWFGEHHWTPTAGTAPPPAPPVSVQFAPAKPKLPPSPATRAIVEIQPPVVATAIPHEETRVPKPLPPPVYVPPPPPRFHPVTPANLGLPNLDDQIGQSITRGVTFLLGQFQNGELREYQNNPTGRYEGMDALAVYALLQAGEATHDARLAVKTPEVEAMLEALKKFPMDKEDSTYSRSLRSAALSVYHRAEDKKALQADAKWLIDESFDGAFTYRPQTVREVRSANPRNNNLLREARIENWDNSNSQYGALGVWAALEAGVEVSNTFWTAVQKHWLGCQLPNGEWGYHGYGEMGRLSMTVAGITTLLVTEDQLDQREVLAKLGHPPFTPALQKGLNWLEAGDNSVRLPAYYRTYNLFGLERAALASGFKYFGTHDWYQELAREQIQLQNRNIGSWGGGQEAVVDTAYTLLFLSRGRHPIFMNKLRFDTYWANRPRDIANLSHYASTVLERPINWQVVSLKSDWSDWMDSPVLYIASHEPLKFTEQDISKLRAFAENGGLIFTHADGDSPGFSKSVAELSHQLFPEYPLTDLPITHPIYSSLYKIKQPVRLEGVSNGSRLLLLHSPTDINKAWQQRDPVQHLSNFQMGINIFIYAAGKTNLRNKLKTPLVPDPQVTPVITRQLARLKYPGDWDPEPAAWPRFTRLLLGETSVKLQITDVDPSMLDPKTMPVAQLSGTVAVHYDSAQLKAISDYVEAGGILIIDATGGSKLFMKSMLEDLLPHAFPKTVFNEMRTENPILAGTGEGMTPVTLKVRPYLFETQGGATRPIQAATLGKGMILLSSIDLTTALLGTSTWAVDGYTPETAYDLVRNAVLFALEKD